MARRKQVRDLHGRFWTVMKVRRKDAEEADFRFWYEELSAEQRVAAVAEALESCSKTRGLNGIPRLRRVHRRIQCPWSAGYLVIGAHAVAFHARPRAAWKQRIESRFGGVPTQYIGLQDLISNKEATDRTQDRADAGVLRRAATQKTLRARPRRPQGKRRS